MEDLTWVRDMNWHKRAYENAVQIEVVCSRCGRRFKLWTQKPHLARFVWQKGALCKRCVEEALVRMYFVKWRAGGFMLSQRYPGHAERMQYHKKRVREAMHAYRHGRVEKKSLTRAEER